ncbi:hypothetical protein SAMN06297422_107116 [Lachnospiraceae bacterium]|nr:hypothetical protein SAMN06297422_107116 [Lachnospiraceae bacterium]
MEEVLRTNNVEKTGIEKKIIDAAICLMFLVIAVIMIIAGITCFSEACILSGIIYTLIGIVMSLLIYMYKTENFDFMD